MSLRVYNRKRKFDQTPEPKGKKEKTGQGNLRFVVQMHHASRLHFDLRLEFEGVFRSWAVPKVPSLNPQDQRLAVFVEDHPLQYGSFEGIIPKNNYGAGTVMVWDEGTYVERGSQKRKDSELAMRKGFDKGHMTFVLSGHKLKGEFALIQLKKDSSQKAWLLVKKRDEFSTYKRTEIPNSLSVKTGRTIQEIAAEAEKAGHVWMPKQKTQSKEVLALTKSKPQKISKPAPISKPPKKVTEKKTTAPEKIKPAPIAPSRAQDPMPRKIKPMLASMGRLNETNSNWMFEPASEGLRAIAEVEPHRVHLYSRSGLSFDKKFPEIIQALKELKMSLVLDGEILSDKKTQRFLIRDILYFSGQDLRKLPFTERKEILESAFAASKTLSRSNTIAVSAKHPLPSGKWLALNPESLYKSGVSSEWQLIEHQSSVKKSSNPVFKHKAGTTKLQKAPTKEISFTKNKIATSTLSPSADEPRLTNLEKIYFPDDDLTKGDLINYYKQVAPVILPYLKDRPESLNRHPNGINAAGFYQKDMTGHIPRWLKTTRIFSESSDKSIDYTMVQDERSLLYIANLGCIEIHPWFSRIPKLDHPDFLVIDLDPDGNDFNHVIQIAHEFHNILDAIAAPNFCKTSGATGIHIGVPTGALHDFDTVRAFAESACKIVAKKYPATTSMDRNPNRRRKKIYLDYMQNRRGQTLAAPYCIRPRKGAPVSWPLEWQDLRPGVKPSDFHLGNVPTLLKKRKTDPWKGILGKPIDLAKCVKLLAKKFKPE